MADSSSEASQVSQNGKPAENTIDGEAAVEVQKQEEDDLNSNVVFQVTINLPHQPYKLPVMVSTQEQVQDLRQSIIDQPDTFQYSCFHLEHNGETINDFIELSDVKGLQADSEIKLVEDPYTEKDARMHVIRVRDLIGASGDRVDASFGVEPGESIFDSLVPSGSEKEQASNGSKAASHPIIDYDLDAHPSIQAVLPPPRSVAPKTLKSLVVSPWNPPPHYLRQRGHLLYLQLTTNEGEQFQVTSHITGFYVNKSSNAKFDPMPRQAPKSASAHSLISLISKLSPSFKHSFRALQEHNGQREPLVNFQLTNALPATPWLVSKSSSSFASHQPDTMRTQESYLISGADNADTLRDWNEEFQSTRELPKESVQDRVFRERITSKLFADYNEAAIRGAIACARGEIAPLNPTEQPMSQIFVYNNIFFSFGADGVGTFASEGGDPAARAAVGKDVAGVKLVNQLDVDGLFAPGTIVVDYLGRRIVCQSLVPGIFKQREPDEHQVNYGGVEGRDVIDDDPAFASVFSKVSKAFHIKKHSVWDKEGKKFELEGSVETKGMLGTDGRKYALDLYRLTPLDINWVEKYWCDVVEGETKPAERNYPHRMSVLRPELVEGYWRLKMSEYVKEELKKRREGRTDGTVNGEHGSEETKEAPEKPKEEQSEDRVDISGFSFDFNPDVYCGQLPQTQEQKDEWAQDEQRVRDASSYLTDAIIPDMIKDLDEGDVGFPMDGASLSKLMHKRGVNMRYLGHLASATKGKSPRLQALADLAALEMITRAFKHVASGFLQSLPTVFASACLSHLLNCLLGEKQNAHPKASLDAELQSFYPGSDWSFSALTPQALQKLVEQQVQLRFRYTLDETWVARLKHLQTLREVCLKLGLQLAAKDYSFGATPVQNGTHEETPETNGVSNGSKKKKKNGEHKTTSPTESSSIPVTTTFVPDDIVNIVPLHKGSAPRSVLADEALEAGRLSLAQGQKELGQELLVESLSLHEQIYGIVHPEVARVYHQLSMQYYQIDLKDAATELARKAVILSERTLGLDHSETVLSYLNLGLFEHAAGNTKTALHYIHHALELWKIACGPRHPDSITTTNNAAVMLQSLKLYKASRAWFEKSLEVCQSLSGKDSVAAATLCFQLAQGLALDRDEKGAVARMREAYNIFLQKLGAEDRNTKESEYWLEQLTQNAVSVAKHAKDLQARKLRRMQLGGTAGLVVGGSAGGAGSGTNAGAALATRPQPAPGQSSAEATGRVRAPSAVTVDQRSVDELIRFIEGGEKTSAAKKRAKTNPKKRGARA